MSDPCLSGLVDDSDLRGGFPLFDTDFHDEDDEAPVVTLRLEMEHPSGDRALSLYVEYQVIPEDFLAVPTLLPAFFEDISADLETAVKQAGGIETWLTDPARAQALFTANEQPGGTC